MDERMNKRMDGWMDVPSLNSLALGSLQDDLKNKLSMKPVFSWVTGNWRDTKYICYSLINLDYKYMEHVLILQHIELIRIH